MKVPSRIAFKKGIGVPKAVQDECNLQSSIPAAIVAAAADATLVDGRGDLDLEISGLRGPGGWIFSGAKWVEVSGTLRRGGRSYHFRALRRSVIDPFAGGTCGILAKCGRAIATDLAPWLENPVDGAVLGDAR